ncbi:MAG: type II/IV secretion system protein, partial [Mesorhizobium sp.]
MNAAARTLGIEAFLAFLESENVLSAHAAQRALGASRTSGHPFDTVMTELGLIGEQELADSLSRFMKLPSPVDIPEQFNPELFS